MRLALPGSALVHVLALGAGLLMFNWSDPEDAPAATAVSVEVIAMASVSANETSTIQSNATETSVSSGAEAIAPVPPDTLEPVHNEIVQPTDTAPVETSVAEQVPLQTAPSLEAIDLPDLEPVLSVATIDPVQTQTITPQAAGPALAPVETNDVKVAPVPHVLTRPRPDTPRQTQRSASAQPPKTQPKNQPTSQPRQQPATPAGSGGQNQTDSVASKPAAVQQGKSGSGGSFAVARYPSQVLGKLRRALRYPSGAGRASGEVHVQFVVAANGSPSGMRVVQSSGNPAIDRAGIDTVSRAAPFPPIPADAGRDSWLFTVPLAFVR